MDNATTTLRGLLSTVRRYSKAPNILFAVPSTLSQVCRALGFKNDCRDGKVYVTDYKLRWLTEQGLPAAIQGEPAGFFSTEVR